MCIKSREGFLVCLGILEVFFWELDVLGIKWGFWGLLNGIMDFGVI